MHKLLCATAMSAILCSSPAYASDSGAMKGELSRGEDGKIKVTPFPKASSYASCSAIENAPVAVREIVEPIAMELGLESELVMALIAVESNYNHMAVSPKGATGLMQLMLPTASRFGVSDMFNPADNIRGGVLYIKYLTDLYDGHLPFVLAAYNAGEVAVHRYNGVPNYKETLEYIVKVQGLLNCKPKVI